MALVAYDNSSESETEEIEESNSKVILNGASRSSHVNSITDTTNGNVATAYSEDIANRPLFTHLPQPKTNENQAMIEEEDEFLKKKEQPTEKPRKLKQPVKIGILALSDFNSDDEDDDDDEPQKKRSKQDLKASGLFSLLPPPKVITPKTNTCFVPNVLQKKVTPKPNKPVKVPPKDKTTSTAKHTPEADKSTNDDDEDDVDDDDIEVPETFDDEMWQKICGKQKQTVSSVSKQTVVEDTTNMYEEPPIQMVELAPEVEKPYTGLDNQAFKELVGSKKRQKGNINLIDIHEDEIRPDREEWLKSLTDPNCEPQTEIKDPVNNTCRAKNHITALAQKALANDKELQMRWAESRHNRRQTQAKYGF